MLDDSLAAATLSDHDFAYALRHGLWLVQTSERGWLIEAIEHPAQSRGLLGCIEQHDGGFELMELGGGFAWSTFPTMLCVLEYMSRPSAQACATDAPPAS